MLRLLQGIKEYVLMNRITQAFVNKKAFIAFVTGGDPDIATTSELIIAMAESGADIIEIGIPFSDPVAEGVVIQDASKRALLNGCTVDKLFDMVRSVREKVDIPLLFMTYINPVFVYGSERFMSRCADCGIDGVIVPDLPFEEKDELAGVSAAHGITQISMISPASDERVDAIAKEAEGFLYCVSSMGVTGMRGELDTNIGKTIMRVKQVSNVPCAIGFGISTPEQAREMASISDGVIIGSAIVRLAHEQGAGAVSAVREFTSEIRKALDASLS